MAQQRLLHGQTHFGVVSRFVDEIPAAVLHHLSPASCSQAAQQHSSQRSNPFHSRSPAAQTPEKAQNYAGFTLGQNVRHAKFGTGVIIDAVNKGDSAKLTVNFGKNGIKVLDTAAAKLSPL